MKIKENIDKYKYRNSTLLIVLQFLCFLLFTMTNLEAGVSDVPFAPPTVSFGFKSSMATIVYNIRLVCYLSGICSLFGCFWNYSEGRYRGGAIFFISGLILFNVGKYVSAYVPNF